MTETITIEKLVYGGDGLARVEGRVILVPFVLPGERAEVELVDKLRARLVRIESASTMRVQAPCPYFGICGGCHYQHAPYAYQLGEKISILREVMQRIGKFTAPEHIEFISGPEFEYRNRVQLHHADGKVGYLEMGSHRLCPIERCPISSPRINECIRALVKMARDRRFPPFLKSVEVFTNEQDVQLNVKEAGRPLAKWFFDWCGEQIPGYKSGPIQYGRFRVGGRSFFQVNRFLIDALVEEGIGAARGGTAIDLYAGVGLFSVSLKERFDRVIAVEGGGAAADDLRENAPGVEVQQADVAEFLMTLEDAPDLLLADPPRAGLGKAVTHQIVRLHPSRVHLVACDPTTLARDIAVLLENGYAIERMAMVDLFPQTYHIETVVQLAAS